MMGWEYMLIERTLDGERLNELGAEGWEMVAVVSPAHFVFHYFFKRRLVDRPVDRSQPGDS